MTFECDGKADEMDEDEDHDHNAYRGKKVMVAKVQAILLKKLEKKCEKIVLEKLVRNRVEIK